MKASWLSLPRPLFFLILSLLMKILGSPVFFGYSFDEDSWLALPFREWSMLQHELHAKVSGNFGHELDVTSL